MWKPRLGVGIPNYPSLAESSASLFFHQKTLGTAEALVSWWLLWLPVQSQAPTRDVVIVFEMERLWPLYY